MNQDLIKHMQADLLKPCPPGLTPLLDKLRIRFGTSLRAVILYGSCRRIDNTGQGLVDLMVIVSSYRAAYGLRPVSLFNILLPPNVYYLEAVSDQPEAEPGQKIRCKYIVISKQQFSRRCHTGFDAYFWARFTQPCRLVWPEDGRITASIAVDRTAAAGVFTRKAIRLGDGRFTAESFWARALSASYACELRPEPPGTALKLIRHDEPFWKSVTAHVIEAPAGMLSDHGKEVIQIQLSRAERVRGRLDWGIRRFTGKIMNVLRLLKAAGTFANGLDYLVWKIERHSGVRIEPTDRMRKHPRIAAWGLAIRLWRAGAFR